MESTEDGDDPYPRAYIGDIPEEVLELIFGHLSPYEDMKSVMFVCRKWHRVVSDLIVKLQRNFRQMLRSSQMHWSFIKSEQSPTISDRFSHSACYLQQSMYVFGGCSATSTTFNDLWRFDLSSRQWARPVASGTYPSPKACASMVVYKDSLVLYGGWSRPTPMPLHQAPRYFNELHTYTPASNRWSQIMAVSSHTLNGVAGHSASIMGHCMVVFGGSHDTGSGCNEVCVFDLVESQWKKPIITGKKPGPRYGQSQKTLDSEHVMIIGGCGGPNQMFNDVWLLRLRDNCGTWEEIAVEGGEFAPPALWCHPPCMVDDLAVFISKNSRTNKVSPPDNPLPPQPGNNRGGGGGGWIPPQLHPNPRPPLHNGAHNHPHIPPPPPFPSMAAFNRRRQGDMGMFGGAGGVGLGGMGGIPLPLPPPRNPPEIVQQPNYHGAQNPNIQDVQRLNLRSAAAAQVLGGGGGGGRGALPPSPGHPHHHPAPSPSTSSAHRRPCNPLSLNLSSSAAGGGGGGGGGYDNDVSGGAGVGQSPREEEEEEAAGEENDASAAARRRRRSSEGNPSSAMVVCDGGVGTDGASPSPSSSALFSPEGSLSPHTPDNPSAPSSSSSSQHHNRLRAARFSPMDSDSSDSDLNPDGSSGGAGEGGGGETSSGGGGGGGGAGLRPGLPSVRPNAMHNRQRQLDMLRKHEDRLRSRNNTNNSRNGNGGYGQGGVGGGSGRNAEPRNPMVLHVLDYSGVLASRAAAWLPVPDSAALGAPEETIFYSLVEGRGELVLFGGIQHDHNPMQRLNSPPNSAGPHLVSNGLYLLSPKWLPRL